MVFKLYLQVEHRCPRSHNRGKKVHGEAETLPHSPSIDAILLSSVSFIAFLYLKTCSLLREARFVAHIERWLPNTIPLWYQNSHVVPVFWAMFTDKEVNHDWPKLIGVLLC